MGGELAVEASLGDFTSNNEASAHYSQPTWSAEEYKSVQGVHRKDTWQKVWRAESLSTGHTG